ncbi:hypothetical protein D9M69_703630 [compost metagenome]
MPGGQGFDVGAGALAILPQGQQLADFGQGKAQVARAFDEGQAVQVLRAVQAVAAVAASGGR